MFTLNDICNIAVQIEHNGETIYRAASQRANDPQVADMFKWMADEEMRHAQWFGALMIPSPGPLENDEIETMGQSLLREMMKNQTFSLEGDQLASIVEIQGLLAKSLEFERDTILFYEMLRAFIDETGTIDRLNMIIKEERVHVQQIELLQASYAGKKG